MNTTAFNRLYVPSPAWDGMPATESRAPSQLARDKTPRNGSAGSQPSSPKRSRWVKIGGATLAVFAAGAAYQAFSPKPEAAPAAVHAEPEARAVRVVRPEPAGGASVTLPATFRPWQATSIHARVSGYLTRWHRDLGERVQAGDLLAEIETPELDQEVAEGEATASEAAAAAVQARAEHVEAEAELRVAEAQQARAEAEAQLARSQLVRREKLLATRAISPEDYDTFRTQVDARVADVAAAAADVARRRTNLDTRAAVIAAREAAAKSRLANVERLRELQAFKRIVAPFAGVVTRREAEVGMLVTAGKEALFTVEDMSRIRVQVQAPQTYAAQTVPGAAAKVQLPESTLPAVNGTITRVSQSVDPSNRTMLAEIELDNAEHNFQPGSYGQVTLTTAAVAAQWTIPSNTLSMRIDGPHVAIANEANEIRMQRVSLGRDLGQRVVVIEGITGAERLVVNPSDDLKSGMPIRVGGSTPSVQGVALH